MPVVFRESAQRISDELIIDYHGDNKTNSLMNDNKSAIAVAMVKETDFAHRKLTEDMSDALDKDEQSLRSLTSTPRGNDSGCVSTPAVKDSGYVNAPAVMPTFQPPRTNPIPPSNEGKELAVLTEDNFKSETNAIGVAVTTVIGVLAPAADGASAPATVTKKNNENRKANMLDNVKIKLRENDGNNDFKKMETKSITKEEIMLNVTLDTRKSISTGKTNFPQCEQLKKTLFFFASEQLGFRPTGTENKANIAAMDGLFPAAVDDTRLAAVCSPQYAAASSQTSPIVGQKLSK